MTDRAELRQKIQGMKQTLKAGIQTASSPDLFPTPFDVARRMVGYSMIAPGMTVLEPSAGTGNIVSVLNSTGAVVTAIELNHKLAESLGYTQGDFLEMEPRPFDRVVMNPPFSNGADIRHILRALLWLKPGGILVAIHADGPRQSQAFDHFERMESLPAGTFAGTNVRAAIIRYQRTL